MKKLYLLLVLLFSGFLTIAVFAQEATPASGDTQPQPADQSTAQSSEQSTTQQPDQSTTQSADQQSADQATKSKAKTSPFGLDLGIGSETINGTNYTSIALQPDLAFGKFGVGLDLLLRLNGKFQLYGPDWDDWTDIVGKINYIRWDKKGAPLFIKLGLLDNVYLGHGSIFYRYSNKLLLPSVRRIGAQFDLDLKVFGWELFDDDIINNRIFGGRLYFRPFANKNIFFLNKWAIGISAGADIALDKTLSPTNSVTIVGADIDIPIFNVPNVFQLLLYTDAVKNLYFTDTMDGTGLIPGFMFNILGFQFFGEYHIYNPKFDGPYFDVFYDINRNTKLAALSTLTNKRVGWSIKMAKSFAQLVSVGFNMGGVKDYNPNMHFEINLQKKIMDKIKGSIYYDKIDIPTFQNVFKIEDINSKFTALVFYSLSKNIDLIIKYQKSFQINNLGVIESTANYGIETKLHLF